MFPLDSEQTGQQNGPSCGSFNQNLALASKRRSLPSLWYCVEIYHKMEDLALLHLKTQHYQTFMPTCPAPIEAKRNKEPRPLFPGYLFVQINFQTQRWHEILSTVGVKHIFRDMSGYPRAMPNSVMRLAKEQSMDFINDIDDIPGIAHGDIVRMREGPWSLQSAFAELVDKDRVRILLSLFGQPMPMTVLKTQVVKV